MPVTKTVEAVQSAYAAFARGDLQTFLEALTPDVVWQEPGPTSAIPWAGTWRGREGVKQWIGVIGRTLEIEKLEPREFVAQGDKVVVLGAERGRFKSTAGVYESEFAMVFTLRDGKIAAFRAHLDTAAIEEAARPA